ncbi:MAG: hypothetical protein ACRESO_05335, partial [Gammaproteobacteria bacterium]
MKRQILVGLVAGALFAFTGLTLAQGTPAEAGAQAPAPAATAPAKKEAAKHEEKHEMHHKKA